MAWEISFLKIVSVIVVCLKRELGTVWAIHLTYLETNTRVNIRMERGKAKVFISQVMGKYMREGGVRIECMEREENTCLMGNATLCTIIMEVKLKLLLREELYKAAEINLKI